MTCRFWNWNVPSLPRCDLWRDPQTGILRCPACVGDVRRCEPAVELARRRLEHEKRIGVRR